MKNIVYINAEIGQCAGVDGCQFAPKAIMVNTPAVAKKVKCTITQNIDNRFDASTHLVEFSNKLACCSSSVVKGGSFPIIIGGDHSTGIGTWSGITSQSEDFGLLWIDAHLDLHTPETSKSGNIHGMSVAILLGYGAEKLTSIGFDGKKIKPENMFFVGIRCFELPEQQLAEKLGIKIYYAKDVNEKGFKDCFENVITHFKAKNIPFGISFDMDSLDVSEMTSLGTPVENGLILNDVVDAFNTVDMTGLRALEVVEYNPTLDKTGKDVIPVQKILQCFDKDIEVIGL